MSGQSGGFNYWRNSHEPLKEAWFSSARGLTLAPQWEAQVGTFSYLT